MNFTLLILQSIYFLVPAYFANMAPVIAQKMRLFPKLAIPIDNHLPFFDKKPLFGNHKTYRGLILGSIAGILGAYIQAILYPIEFFHNVSILNYTVVNIPLFLGFLMGFGAISGDLIKSFFKRRINIKAGNKFIPFDQIDFVFGAYLFVLPFYYIYLNYSLFFSSLLCSFFLHIIINRVAFYLKIRKEKW